MEQDSSFEFVGFMAIFVVAGAAIYAIQIALGNSAVLQSLHGFSPWLAEHAKPFSWVASAVVLITAIALPPLLMSKEFKDGNSRLTTIGFIVWAACLFPSIGYLLSVGWFGFRAVSGI